MKHIPEEELIDKRLQSLEDVLEEERIGKVKENDQEAKDKPKIRMLIAVDQRFNLEEEKLTDQ